MIRILNLQQVPFTDVTIGDAFWAPRREINRSVSIPRSLDMLEKAGNLANFEMAMGATNTGYNGPVFMDSDIYKGLEAAAYSLATNPDPILSERVDRMIAIIAAAQLPDGYLNSYYQVMGIEKRLTNLAWHHELYCAGHLFEAAVAHHQATGKVSLLSVATKFADFLCSSFGPDTARPTEYCGHPEVELALFKLWRATGEQRYFDLAEHFINVRGQRHFEGGHGHDPMTFNCAYFQDDIPIFDHDSINGHAVRAAYLFSGATDVASITGDPRLLDMLSRVWSNTVYRRMYVTGGIGPSAANEGFTEDYDLPNLTAYQETCASVALAMWNHRLGLLSGESKYWDYVERALYNGFLAGISLDGERYFYVNPLASGGDHHRSEWFGCACCPPNVTRTLASLGQYAYAKNEHDLYVNLFIGGEVSTLLGDYSVKFKVETDYPWEGRVTITCLKPAPDSMALMVRVPLWSADYEVSSQQRHTVDEESGYIRFAGPWKEGVQIVLSFPMAVNRVTAHHLVKSNRGRAAMQRGPLIYCLEQCDQAVPLSSIVVPSETKFEAQHDLGLLGGVTTLTGPGMEAALPEWDADLYQRMLPTKPVIVKAVPYYAWDNREPGAMEVWVRTCAQNCEAVASD